MDETNTQTVVLRRAIYLTIMSSLNFEECAHKLMKMSIKDDDQMELCNMLIECCSQVHAPHIYFKTTRPTGTRIRKLLRPDWRAIRKVFHAVGGPLLPVL